MYTEPFTPSFFRSLQQLKIRTRRAFLGSRQGSHRSLRRGHGLEFTDFRVYTPGDDFRHIDWGVYGRTDRLYVRQFTEEQDLNVVVLLDGSLSMAYPEGEGKFELARDLALALGCVALTDGDAVTYSILGHTSTPRYVGPKALSRATQALYQIVPAGQFNLADAIREAIATQKIPGKCFLLSDFLVPLEEFYDALDIIRSRNFDVSVIQVLSPSELKLDLAETSYLAVDAESGEPVELSLDRSSHEEYGEALATHVAQIEAYCQKAAISHVLISSEEALSDVVLTRLPELGILK